MGFRPARSQDGSAADRCRPDLGTEGCGLQGLVWDWVCGQVQGLGLSAGSGSVGGVWVLKSASFADEFLERPDRNLRSHASALPDRSVGKKDTTDVGDSRSVALNDRSGHWRSLNDRRPE